MKVEATYIQGKLQSKDRGDETCFNRPVGHVRHNVATDASLPGGLLGSAALVVSCVSKALVPVA